MTFEDFYRFVDKTIDELHQTLEIYRDRKIEIIEIQFSWGSGEKVLGRESVILEIMDKVYVGEDQIYPFVDLHARIKRGILIIEGQRLDYPPTEFGIGWSGRKGPFIYGIGSGPTKDSERIRRQLSEKAFCLRDSFY